MSRIIAGRARGRRLRVPKGVQTRPTTDRTREALFSTLQSWSGGLESLALLDLYSGSGAIALEAASRGVDPVVAVESNGAAAALISSNARDLGLVARVVSSTVSAFLAREPTRFDIVFADPPYHLANQIVEADLVALTRGWLAPDGLVVVERARRDAAFTWPAEFADSWERHYGETTLYFATGKSTQEDRC